MTHPLLSVAKTRCLLIAVAYLGLAGCATTPTEKRARMIDFPLASTHAGIGFTITTGARQHPICDKKADCPTSTGSEDLKRFELQVRRVAGALQRGAQDLFPDLEQRVPQLVGSRFDVYVVDGDEPGSASSADGRIVLQGGLGIRHPYDDWVAFVIAREMGHVIARHHEENSSASMATSIIMNIVIPGSSLLKMLISSGGSAIAAQSKSEVQALEADAIAADLLKAAGFRQRNVYLTLVIDPMLLDDGAWSKEFRKSSDNFIAKFRQSEFAVAAVR